MPFNFTAFKGSATDNENLFSELLKSIQKGDLNQVRSLIQSNPRLKTTRERAGRTALHYACTLGSPLTLIKLLVNEGIDVNAQTADGTTSLMIVAGEDSLKPSAQEDNIEVVKYLVSSGADPNIRCDRNHIALHYAIYHGWTKIALYLVPLVDDINHRTSTGTTPINMAAMALVGRERIVQVLLENGADPNIPDILGQKPLDFATRLGYKKIVELLLKHRVDVNYNKGHVLRQSPLFCAVDANDISLARSLLESGGDANTRDLSTKTPLHVACEHEAYEMVELLLNYGADPNIKEEGKSYTALYSAVKLKSVKLVTILLKYGANVNVQNKVGILPIHVAARTSSTELVKLLLSHGAYYNTEANSNKCSGTPVKLARKRKDTQLITVFELIERLFCAIEEKDSHRTEHCIKAGAIVNARNAEGKTALVCAVSKGMIETTNLLLEYGADVALATNEGVSPLHIAVGEGNKEIVQILLTSAKEVDPIKRNKVINAQKINDSATVLHIAAEKNSLPFVELLLENGAVYNAKNKAGKTPMCLSTNEAIRGLFKSADKLFKKVKNGGAVGDLTQVLEKNKSIVNARDSSGGGTLLYWSVAKEQTKIVKFLLNNGADFSLVTDKGTSPLHIAASKSHVDLVSSIIVKAMQCNPKNVPNFVSAVTVNGTTPLHVATDKEVVICLLQAGASYNALNKAGKTPLELSKNESVRELLNITDQIFLDVQKGNWEELYALDGLAMPELAAVTKARNASGKTLVEVAQASGHASIAQKLTEKMNRSPFNFQDFLPCLFKLEENGSPKDVV